MIDQYRSLHDIQRMIPYNTPAPNERGGVCCFTLVYLSVRNKFLLHFSMQLLIAVIWWDSFMYQSDFNLLFNDDLICLFLA